MTRHTLDLHGKRDEEKAAGEEEMEAAYLDWRKRWQRSSPAGAVAAESESGVTYGSGAAKAEVVTTNGKKDPRDTYGPPPTERKAVSVR